MSDEKFQGFVWPQENWFRLPNNWTDITASISSLAELKIIMYVLRHTWGYNERHRKRWITNDEFMSGRKGKGGVGRLDKGTGLSRTSVIKGLKQAVEDGFLLVFIDDRDKGRIKKRYQLNMEDQDEDASVDKYPESSERGIEVETGGTESVPRSKESVPRTEERHLKGKTEKSKRAHTRVSSEDEDEQPSEKKPSITQHKPKWTKWDKKQGAKLRQIMVEQDTDLEHNRRITGDTYTENIYMIRSSRGRSQEQIEELLEWYRRNYSDTYTPKLKYAYDFLSKFGSILDAMGRKQDGGQSKSEEDEREEIDIEFNHLYFSKWPDHPEPRPEESNTICEEMGIPPRFRYEGQSERDNPIWSRI